MNVHSRAPAQSSASWLWPLLAVAGVALTIVPRLRWINIYEDQAVISGAAMQAAAGQVPYRDFAVAVTPGSLFLYAAYYKVVGATVVHQRVLTGAAMLFGVFLVAYIGRRVLGNRWAAGTALLWGVWLPVFQEYSPYHFWSIAFTLAMAAALVSARESKRPRLMFALAGLAASGALLMLQGSMPAVLAGLAAAGVIDRRLGRSVLPMLVALTVPGLVVLVALGLMGALPEFVNDTVVYAFTSFGPSQALPFPWQPGLLHDTSFWEASIAALWAIPMHWLLAVVAPVVVAVATIAGVWRRRRRLADCPDWLIIGILATGLFASSLIGHLTDQNLWLTSALTLVLVVVRLRLMVASTSSSRILAGAAAVPIAAIYLAGLSPLVLGYAVVCHTDGTGFLRQVDAPGGSVCVTFDSVQTVTGAVRFNADHPGSTVAFLPAAPSLYEITGRTPQLPEILVIPGVTTDAQLARVESAMRAQPVEWVVYYKIDFRKDLPADRALNDGSRSQFDQYLDQAYQREDQNGLVVYHLKR